MKAKIINKKFINKNIDVYDLEINKNHNFYANDILVHNCKSWSSQQGTNLLKTESKYMIAMTGTPIMNNPLDCYVPLAWIGIERKKNITNFKKTFCIYSPITKGQIIGYKNTDLLKEELEAVSLRRTKDIVDLGEKLPEKIVIDEFVEMSEEHRKFYDDVKKGVKEECDKIVLNASNSLALVTRLRQATSCPSMLTTKNILSSKIERCLDLVEEITNNGYKVVIFGNFKEPVYQLKELLKDYNPLIGTGDMKDSEVSNNVDLFQNDDKYKVFIGTYAKCSTGITLNKASYMICIDDCWTYALTEQAEDRIHRIGSKNTVFIYHLICENTIDVAVRNIVNRKKQIAEFIVDNFVPENLSKELIQILTDM